MEQYELVSLETEDEHQIGRWKGVRKVGAAQPISVVSARTVLFPHETALEVMDEMDLSYEVEFINNDTLMFAKIEPDLQITLEGTDEIDLGVEVVNNLKRPKVSICPYTFRIACTNQMEHGTGLVSYPHRAETKERYRKGLEIMVKDMEKIKDVIERKYTFYKSVEIDKPKAVEILDSGTPKKYIEEVKVSPIQNGWDLFNLLTDMNTHDTKRTEIGKRNFNRFLEKAMDSICAQAAITA